MLIPLMLVATLVAVGLLVAVMVRLGKRFDEVKAEMERMKVVQRDMSSDVRTRLEEGARTWESVEGEIRPKLAQLESLEPSVADLSAALEENLPALTDARKRLEAVEAQVEGTESRVTAALEAGAAEAGERCERIEHAVRTLRNAADERLAEVTARVTALECAPEKAEPSPPQADEAVVSSATPPPIPATAAARGPSGESRPHRSRGTDDAGKGRSHWLLALVLIAGVVALVAALS